MPLDFVEHVRAVSRRLSAIGQGPVTILGLADLYASMKEHK